MWLFTQYGFVSVTRPKKSPIGASGQPLQVRARDAQHLHNLQAAFPDELGGLQVVELPNRDYRYRLYVIQESWAIVQAKLVQQIDYSNFKDRCHDVEPKVGAAYVKSLSTVWGVMHGLQAGPQKPGACPGVNGPRLGG